MAYSNTFGIDVSFEGIMAFLHSINLSTETKRSVGHSLMDEASREDAGIKLREQFRLKKDLELFETYQDNWDGEGGKPLNPDVVLNFEKLLPLLSSRCLTQIDVCPENNGSLLLMWRDKEAGINIGSTTYTYYQTNGSEVSGESHLPFNIDDVLKQAEKIAA
ncbi:MAG: hypothetical protein II838_13565 [Lachnospiraceae bacterium]|nr:hypothetical protein [Lachnospiraceae bacterium]